LRSNKTGIPTSHTRKSHYTATSTNIQDSRSRDPATPDTVGNDKFMGDSPALVGERNTQPLAIDPSQRHIRAGQGQICKLTK
jgi:hypothetical protein